MGNNLRMKLVAIGLIASITIGVALHHSVEVSAKNKENDTLCQAIPGLKSVVTKRDTTTYKIDIEDELVTYKVTKKGKVKKLVQTTENSNKYVEMVQIGNELTVSEGNIISGKYIKKLATVVDLGKKTKEQKNKKQKPIKESISPVGKDNIEETEEEQNAKIQNAFIRAFYSQYKENYWLQDKPLEINVGCKLDSSKYCIKKNDISSGDMQKVNEYAASVNEFSNLRKENSKEIFSMVRALITTGIADGRMLLALISCLTPLTAIFALLFFVTTASIIVYMYLKYIHNIEARLERMDVLAVQLGEQYISVAALGVAY